MDNLFKNTKVGDYIKFGNYPQTANGQNQPIEWQVLSKENNKMLVISKYGLEVRRFDSGSNNWRNSEIRNWLNGEFYNKAFNEKEKKSIKSSNLSDVGTSDNVFLLSKEEAEKYFVNDNARRCKATEYSVKNGACKNDEGYGYWWLRSPRLNRGNRVYDVFNFGSFNYSYSVLDCGSFNCYCVFSYYLLVRPALWINL